MPKYGIIKDGNLFTSSSQLEGYKPIRYAKIPDDFDQTTQYVMQTEPREVGDEILVGIEIHDLDIEEDEEFDEGIF